MSDKLKTGAAAHTPEPWLEYDKLQYEESDGISCSYVLDRATLQRDEYERARLCVHACAGLTAEKVAAIPTLIHSATDTLRRIKANIGWLSDRADHDEGLSDFVTILDDSATELERSLSGMESTIPAKLTAFEAIREACAELIQGYACGEFRGAYNSSQRRIQKARAALELADACEAKK